MTDTFIYPIQRCRLDAVSLTLADQIVRCLGTGNTDVANGSTSILHARALRLTGLERAFALLVLREMYQAHDEFAKARDLSPTVQKQFQNLGDTFGLALNLSIDASVSYYEGYAADSAQRVTEITKLISELSDDDERAIIEAAQHLGEIRTLMAANKYVQALDLAEKTKKAVKAVKMPGTDRLFYLTLCFQGRLFYFLHDYRNAERVFLRLIEQDWYIDEAHSYLGRIKYHNRELDQAAEIFEHCLARFSKKNNLRRMSNVKEELARTKLAMGLEKDAERLFQQAHDDLDSTAGGSKFPFERARALLGIAQCQYRAKHFPSTLASLGKASKLFDDIRNVQNQIRCKNLEALTLAELGEHGQANDALADAERRLVFENDHHTVGGRPAVPYRIERATLLRSKALLAARQGRYPDAVTHSSEAISILRMIHVPDSDELYTDVLLESVLFLFVTSQDHDGILQRLRTARRLAEYRRQPVTLLRVYLLRAACLGTRSLVAKATTEFRKTLAIARSLGARDGRPAGDIVLDSLDVYLRIAGPNRPQIERFINGLVTLLDCMTTNKAHPAEDSDLPALRGQLIARLGKQGDAYEDDPHPVSNVELLHRTLQADRRKFGGPEYFFERLRTADYSDIIAATQRCSLLEEIADFEKSRLPDLIRLTQQYHSPAR